MATYNVLHSYKETIIVPYVGIKSNIDFLFDKEDRFLLTRDNITCKVVSCVEKNILELEDDIKTLYGCDLLTWMRKWHNAHKYFNSLEVLVITLKKV